MTESANRQRWADIATEARESAVVVDHPPAQTGRRAHPETLAQGDWTRDEIARHYERDLLWVMLNEADRCPEVAQVFPIVDSSDFLSPHGEQLFEILRRMHQRTGTIDVVSLMEQLAAKGPRLADLSGYVSGLWVGANDTAQPWRVLVYAKEVHERAQQRRLVTIAEVEREALSGRGARLPDGTFIDAGTPANEVIGITDAARRRLAKASNGAAVSSRLSSFRERALAAQERCGLPFGLRAVDDLLRGGAHNGHLVVIGGRPGMGKTAFLLNAVTSWTSAGSPGVVFSLEMSGGDLYGRMLSSRSGLSADEWSTDWDRVLDAADEVDKLNVHIADAPQMTLDTIRAECDRRHAEGTLRWIMVDYLTLMGTDPSLKDHHLRVGANCTGLKAIAKDYDIPVILAAQLNRELEKRANKRPQPADLRDAGQIEQDADVIVFLYREVVYDESANPNEAEIIVAKHRGGAIGTLLVGWNGPLTRFENLNLRDGGML